MGASHSGRWECKRLAELREIHRAPTLLPTVGVLEVLAHEIDVAWVTRDRQVSGGKFFAPPRVAERESVDLDERARESDPAAQPDIHPPARWPDPFRVLVRESGWRILQSKALGVVSLISRVWAPLVRGY